jgi:hypothetical protein
MGNIAELGQLICRHLPWLGDEYGALFAEGALTLLAGMYPFSNPTAPVAQAMADIGMPDPRERFADGLREGLVSWLIGAAVRADAVDAEWGRRRAETTTCRPSIPRGAAPDA